MSNLSLPTPIIQKYKQMFLLMEPKMPIPLPNTSQPLSCGGYGDWTEGERQASSLTALLVAEQHEQEGIDEPYCVSIDSPHFEGQGLLLGSKSWEAGPAGFFQGK